MTRTDAAALTASLRGEMAELRGEMAEPRADFNLKFATMQRWMVTVIARQHGGPGRRPGHLRVLPAPHE